MKLDFTKQSVGSLVARRPNGQFVTPDTLFCTISPNPTTKHPCFKGRKNVKMMYGLMPHRLQYQYCLKILNQCYIPFLSEDAELIGTWELNKTNNIHFHFLINDPLLNSDQRFNSFRRDISCCSLVQDNLTRRKGNKLPIDYMNNIVKVNDTQDDRLDYMDKDHEEDPMLLNYFMFDSESCPLTQRDNSVEIMTLEQFSNKYYQSEKTIL